MNKENEILYKVAVLQMDTEGASRFCHLEANNLKMATAVFENQVLMFQEEGREIFWSVALGEVVGPTFFSRRSVCGGRHVEKIIPRGVMELVESKATALFNAQLDVPFQFSREDEQGGEVHLFEAKRRFVGEAESSMCVSSCDTAKIAAYYDRILERFRSEETDSTWSLSLYKTNGDAPVELRGDTNTKEGDHRSFLLIKKYEHIEGWITHFGQTFGDEGEALRYFDKGHESLRTDLSWTSFDLTLHRMDERGAVRMAKAAEDGKGLRPYHHLLVDYVDHEGHNHNKGAIINDREKVGKAFDHFRIPLESDRTVDHWTMTLYYIDGEGQTELSNLSGKGAANRE